MTSKEYKALRGQLRATLRPIWEHYCRISNGFMISNEMLAISERLDHAVGEAADRLRCTRTQVARMILHI